MTEGRAPVSETGLAYDIFTPLWSIVDLGAVKRAAAPAQDASLREFVESYRGTMNRVLEIVEAVGGFSAESMAIFEEQGGWNVERSVTPEFLMLHTGCIENYPPDLDDPQVLRRMLRAGADLQLMKFLDALIGTAVVCERPRPELTAPLIVDAVQMAGALLQLQEQRVASDAFRMLCVGVLPEVLRPNSPSPEGVRTGYRVYAHLIEEMVFGS